MDDVEQRVVAIVAEQALMEPSDVKLDDTMEDLGIDSLGIVECIYAIEETFDVEVPFNANEPTESDFDISSVSAVVAGVKRLIAAK